MKNEAFVMELKRQLSESNILSQPQNEDEFTVIWYAKVVARCGRGKAKEILESFVADGTMTVRRKVRLTWTIGIPKGCTGDVYKLAGKKARKP